VGGASKVEADDPADDFAPVEEAVAAGDADRAERLVRDHVGAALEAFRSTA